MFFSSIFSFFFFFAQELHRLCGTLSSNRQVWENVSEAPGVFMSSDWLILLGQKGSGDHELILQISHYLQGFIDVRWCRISSINSMVNV